MESSVNFKFCKNFLSVLGISVKEGQQLTGVEEAPKHFREGGLLHCLKDLGWQIKDLGDITKESLQSEIEELEKDTSKHYKYNLPHIEIIGAVNKRLAEINHEQSKQGRLVLNLGGDHGLASGTITGMLRTYPNLKVIWVDAHGDCNTPEISPSGNYHGMPVAHVLGWIQKGDVKAFDWLDVNLKAEDIVYVGLRDLDAGEKKLLKQHNIKFYTPYDIEDMGGIKYVMDDALRFLKADKDDNNPIHVSWDVDGCDPAFIYGTGTKARSGLSERESHYMLQRIAATGNLVSLDVVEINPSLDVVKQREVYHGDNIHITGTQSVCNAIELTLSALGFSWRH
jgi:arginase